MKEFKKVNKIFIKSNNSITKIFNRYLYCLFPFLLLIMVYNLIWGDRSLVFILFKNTIVSFVSCFVFGFIFNIIKKEKSISNLFFKDNILIIAIIIGLFSLNVSLKWIVIAALISVVVRKIVKDITISSSLYGILFMLIMSYFSNNIDSPLSNLAKLSYIGTYSDIVSSYGNILSYSLGLKYYLSPILSILAFIYLFYKKSIKYNIVISYILTISFMMMMIGLFNGMNIWFLFFQLCTGNILFLSVFCLTDYPNTPITVDGQIIYGIILGLLTGILRFIIPEFAVVIVLILGPILLVKYINKLSIKLKKNYKFKYMVLGISIFLVILSSAIISIII